MIEADVLVVGAGPAGATAALNLAPTRRVVLVERRPHIPPRIGESLLPAARRLLADMGLMASFEAEGHAPCYGNRSVWGAPELIETDFMRDPDGPGWHLDRARFDAWLRHAAVARGAQLLTPARIEALDRDGPTWQVSIACAGNHVRVTAAVLIDAGGRGAAVARRLGAHRRVHDRLVCGWTHGQADATGRGAGFTFVEAAEDGWWYTAPLPGGRRVLAFHTDADLPAARVARNRQALLDRARPLADLSSVLSQCNFIADGGSGFTAAHSAVLEPCAGASWLAAGDAALALDPLSAQGLFNALFTGLAAAEAADRHLFGVADALSDYILTVKNIWDAYHGQIASWYGTERRWPNAAFWMRRQQPGG